MVTCKTYIVCVGPCDFHCRIGIRINFSNQNPKILFFSIAMRIFLGRIEKYTIALYPERTVTRYST